MLEFSFFQIEKDCIKHHWTRKIKWRNSYISRITVCSKQKSNSTCILERYYISSNQINDKNVHLIKNWLNKRIRTYSLTFMEKWDLPPTIYEYDFNYIGTPLIYLFLTYNLRKKLNQQSASTNWQHNSPNS